MPLGLGVICNAALITGTDGCVVQAADETCLQFRRDVQASDVAPQVFCIVDDGGHPGKSWGDPGQCVEVEEG